MHQYWFFIGNFPIRAYSTLFVLAFFLGVLVTLYFAKAEGKQEYTDNIWDLALLLLVGGLLGARFWQVFFFDWHYYSQHLMEIPAIWHGGLSIQGGVVGALIFGGIYVWKKKLPFWELADIFAPGLILAQAIGRDANLMNGDAFGGPTGGNFGILYPAGTIARDTFGNQPLWPAEVWEGQFDVILFAVLVGMKLKKLPSGTIFLTYVIVYNLARLLLEYLRGDSPRFLLGWDAAQWSSAVAVVVGVVLLIWRIAKARKDRTPAPAPQE